MGASKEALEAWLPVAKFEGFRRVHPAAANPGDHEPGGL